MMPVQWTVFLNFSAWAMAFWPVVRVQHQQHLVRRAVDLLADDAVDLLQLAHQVRLRVQPAGGVHDQHVEAARLGPFAGVVGHARPGRCPAGS